MLPRRPQSSRFFRKNRGFCGGQGFVGPPLWAERAARARWLYLWQRGTHECVRLARVATSGIKTKITKSQQHPRASRAVPHPSTDRAFSGLSSEFEWDREFSTEYGRWREGTCGGEPPLIAGRDGYQGGVLSPIFLVLLRSNTKSPIFLVLLRSNTKVIRGGFSRPYSWCCLGATPNRPFFLVSGGFGTVGRV